MLFLVGFGLLVWFAGQAAEDQRVVLGSPGWLWGLCLVPWMWWIHAHGGSGLRGFRWAAALWLRMGVVGALLVALAEPSTEKIDRRTVLVYAVDHSASLTAEAQGAARDFVLRTSSDKPQEDEAGLVYFARDAAVELPPASTLPLEAINVELDRGGSDLAAGIQLASALIPAGRPGRVVLVSDGSATEGALLAALDDAVAAGVPVDVVPLDYRLDDEVWLERLDLPDRLRIGEPAKAAVVLSSLRGGSGRLVLELAGERIFAKDVSFRPGKNRYSVSVPGLPAGYHELIARVVPEGGTNGVADTWDQNNVVASSVLLEGKGKVLLVVSEDAEPGSYQPFLQALQRARREVEVRLPSDLPFDPLAFQPFDLVVFMDVPREAFTGTQVDALDVAVREQGSGFLMVGGRNSFGPGGWRNTKVESLLPLRFDLEERQIIPKSAMGIILHTCEFADGNTWAKRISLEAVKVLHPQDEVGILVSDWNGTDDWLIRFTPARNQQRIAQALASARIGDMQAFAPTMKTALQGLKANDAASKHLVIISDGDPQPPSPELLQAYVDAKVTISTVTVFPHGGLDSATMKMIARTTGGTHYQPSRADQLPAIFIKEARSITRSSIEEETFQAEGAMPSQILDGIQGLPPLHGHVLNLAKDRAQVILRRTVEEEDDMPDPVLATWRVGLGAAAAFTSDLGTRWGRDWVGWGGYQGFVRQLCAALSRTQKVPQVRARAEVGPSGEGVVLVEDLSADGGLELGARVIDPSGAATTMRLRMVGPGRAQGAFPLTGRGRYRVEAIGRRAGNPTAGPGDGTQPGGPGINERSFANLLVPYDREYLRFRADRGLLADIARRTGGRMLDPDATSKELFLRPDTARPAVLPVFPWALLIGVILFTLDVAVRRVAVDWRTVKSWFGFREVEAAGTLGSLLKTARAHRDRGEPEDVDETAAARRAALAQARSRRQRETAARASTPATGKRPGPKATPSPPTKGALGSRLLEARRKAQGGAPNEDQPPTGEN